MRNRHSSDPTAARSGYLVAHAKLIVQRSDSIASRDAGVSAALLQRAEAWVGASERESALAASRSSHFESTASRVAVLNNTRDHHVAAWVSLIVERVNEVLDYIQMTISLVGAIPEAGGIASALNSLISLARGNYTDAALDAAAALASVAPVAGPAVARARAALFGTKAAARAAKLAAGLGRARGIEGITRAGQTVARGGFGTRLPNMVHKTIRLPGAGAAMPKTAPDIILRDAKIGQGAGQRLPNARPGIEIRNMGKGRGNIRNDYLEQLRRRFPKATKEELCAILRKEYEEARKVGDMVLANMIKLAQKALGCRRTHYD